MATETELETFAQWLEGQGFVLSRNRAVTLSYLRTVCGTFTATQLRNVCLKLQGRKGQPFHWLALRRMAE